MDKYLLIIIIIVIGLSLYKYFNIYIKAKNVYIKDDLTGYDIARKILDKNMLDDIYIVEVKGKFNDHFDYKQKVVRLSSEVYHISNMYSMAMASFIAMQAVLQKENNQSFYLKKAIEPIYRIILIMSYLFLLISLLSLSYGFVLGVVFLAVCLLYQVIFLKINFDITKRLENDLIKLKIVSKKNILEMKECLTIGVYYDISNLLFYLKVVIDFIAEKLK